ncbi:MAG: hypothetical protein ACSHW1_04715 [Yoonia sp.]|uniref:hypothetical protein n=1 Tax=Yoonia sp. TaxID=2212373 RepID=UPI003EFA1B01
MDIDLIFVCGITMIVLSVPSFVSAYADRRWPVRTLTMLVVAAVAIAYAMQENPDTYSLATIDDTIVTVLGRYLN